jgi:mRNA guanylyltransferase
MTDFRVRSLSASKEVTSTIYALRSKHFHPENPQCMLLTDRHSYFLCEKTDGIRCLLYCTTDQDNEIHYLIDRKNDYYYIGSWQFPFHTSPEDIQHARATNVPLGLHLPHQADPNFRRFHKNTLLDGELVIDRYKNGTEVQRYLVFDCIILDGELLTQKTFDKRMGRIHEFIQKPVDKFLAQYPQAREQFAFDIQMKVQERPYALDDMFLNKLPNLPHGNDGLIFTAKRSFYTHGTDEQILKWKPANENSIDFRLQLDAFPTYDPGDGGPPAEDFDAKPTINLLINHNKNDQRKFAQLFMTDDEWDSMKSLNQQLDGRIIECYVDDERRWRFKREADGTPRFRDDKLEANHVSTMEKVIKSIQDGVSEADLTDAVPKIKDGWKLRHPEERRPPRNDS